MSTVSPTALFSLEDIESPYRNWIDKMRVIHSWMSTLRNDDSLSISTLLEPIYLALTLADIDRIYHIIQSSFHAEQVRALIGMTQSVEIAFFSAAIEIKEIEIYSD